MNKRWSSEHKKYVESAKIDDFLAEIAEVCKRHGLALGHEDSHGAFVVEEFEDWYIDEWLNHAQVGMSVDL